MAVNSMSLPEIRGNPIQAKPVRSTRPEAKAVRLSLPVARQSPCQKDQEERGQGGGEGRSWEPLICSSPAVGCTPGIYAAKDRLSMPGMRLKALKNQW